MRHNVKSVANLFVKKGARDALSNAVRNVGRANIEKLSVLDAALLLNIGARLAGRPDIAQTVNTHLYLAICKGNSNIRLLSPIWLHRHLDDKEWIKEEE